MRSSDPNERFDEQDQDFANRLCEDYHRLMYAHLGKLLGNHDLRDDIFQETFVRLLKKDVLHRVRQLDKKRIPAYLMAMVRHMAYTMLKKQNREAKFLVRWGSYLENILTESGDPESTVLFQEEMQALKDALKELSDEYCFLLEGRYFLGLSDRELAEGLGVKPDSVRMMLTRARRGASKKIKAREKGVE